MSWVELTPPASAAVDLDDLKDHLRLTSSDEDTLIDLYARAASHLFEIKTRRRLIERTFRLDLPAFPREGDPVGIDLPVAPVSAVFAVQYYDTAGSLQTWSSSEYLVDLTSHLPRVVTAPNYFFPVTQSDRPNAVQVSFTAGYGTTPSDVPEGIRWGVLFLAAHAFANRSPVVNGTMTDVPRTLQYVIDAYKIWSA